MLGFRRRKPSDTSNAEIESLKAQIAQLQQQLAASSTFQGEYLHRRRSGSLPLIGPEWDLRYFVLMGTTIKYWASHKDVIFSPREEFSTLGCSVQWKGRQGRYWVWDLIDASGSIVLSVGSPNEETALKWLAALDKSGCPCQTGPPGGARQYSMPASFAPVLGPASPSRPHSVSVPSRDLDQGPGGLSMPATPTMSRPTGTAPASPIPPIPEAAAFKEGAPQAAAAQAAADTCSGSTTPRGAATAPGGTAGEGEGRPTPSKPQGHRNRGPMLASSPVHTASQYSYLSSERVWHERHTGLYNLMAVILLSTNFRLALENALKYGWRYNPVRGLRDLTIGNPNIPVALCYPALVVLALLALLAEQLAYTLMSWELQFESALQKKGVPEEQAARQVATRRAWDEWGIFLINVVITSATLVLPWLAISFTQAEPLAGGVLIGLAIVWWMKLVSLHHCCADLRNARRAGEIRPGERGSPSSPAEWAVLAYPENLTVAQLAYYLAAPTLSYQVNYPRSPNIRWKWLARRLAELVVMLTVLSLIVKQFMEPAIANSMQPLQQMNWLRLCERLLKLALPNTYVWLVMFYCLFHLWLNILAELLRFGDREFYKDWWNAPTLGEYWKLWNMPVHKWLLRHVYFPAIRAGCSRWPAMVAVFFVSAIFHELVLGVPLHCVRWWAFAGIMLQVPMIILTEEVRKRLKRDEAGNYVFWLTFCVVGQPLTMLLYYHDYLYEVYPQMSMAKPTLEGANTTLVGDTANMLSSTSTMLNSTLMS